MTVVDDFVAGDNYYCGVVVVVVVIATANDDNKVCVGVTAINGVAVAVDYNEFNDVVMMILINIIVVVVDNVATDADKENNYVVPVGGDVVVVDKWKQESP